MDTKPGYKTSEFWLSLAAVVVGLLYAAGVVADGSAFDKVLALAASLLGALGYTVSRGGVKKASAAAAALSSQPKPDAAPAADPT